MLHDTDSQLYLSFSIDMWGSMQPRQQHQWGSVVSSGFSSQSVLRQMVAAIFTSMRAWNKLIPRGVFEVSYLVYTWLRFSSHIPIHIDSNILIVYMVGKLCDFPPSFSSSSCVSLGGSSYQVWRRCAGCILCVIPVQKIVMKWVTDKRGQKKVPNNGSMPHSRVFV